VTEPGSGIDAPGPNVVLVRHGETAWTRSGQHTGLTDLDLTEDGVVQARRLGEMLGSFDIDATFTSPRLRTMRTAALAGLPDPVVDDDLQEWDYGELEGLTTPEIREQLPGWSIWEGPWPGGETPEEVAARADRVIARCLEGPPDRTVALVSHGHMLRVIAARWLGAPVAVGRWLVLGTAAVCQLGWEHDYRTLRLWNLTADP
jgi:broad specificity phosphatase PhoE